MKKEIIEKVQEFVAYLNQQNLGYTISVNDEYSRYEENGLYNPYPGQLMSEGPQEEPYTYQEMKEDIDKAAGDSPYTRGTPGDSVA